MEWIVVALAAVVIAMALAVMVIYLRSLRQETDPGGWYVEMWNIRHGYVLQLQFTNTLVVGRNAPYEWGSGNLPTEPDITVSAEHCMLYEENGMVRICNLSVDQKRWSVRIAVYFYKVIIYIFIQFNFSITFCTFDYFIYYFFLFNIIFII